MAVTSSAEQEPELGGPADENMLIDRAKRDASAVAELYRLHYQAIAAHVACRVGSHADVDDLVAETFLTMVRYLPRFKWTGAPFRAWLYRLATNQVNRWAKRRRRWAAQQLESDTADQGETRASSDHDVERLRLAMLTLAPRYQSVLALHYLEEMSVAEVAQVLGCRNGTVKSRLSRGRDALRRLLEPLEP
jgi:RNA polymerase sigma-70 factor, ECF subfamily